MTDSELTGREKLLMCMGYCSSMLREIKTKKEIPDYNLFTIILARLDMKFTNMNHDESDMLIAKALRFSCADAIDDIVDEIDNEILLKQSKLRKNN